MVASLRRNSIGDKNIKATGKTELRSANGKGNNASSYRLVILHADEDTILSLGRKIMFMVE